jgi:hypothetical protein
MKSLLTIIIFAWMACPAFGQAPEDESPQPQDPKVAARIDAARAAYITERLGLSAEEAERFWPIYREFSGKRQELHQQFRAAKKEGKDEQALVNLGLQIKQQELDLEKDYSGRMMKIISAQKLMNLRTAEREFTQIIIRQIQQRQQQIDRRQQLRDRQQERMQQRNN